VSAGWAGLVTFLGLLLALGGVGCGVWAYIDTVREHDDLPVWPWAHRQWLAVRARNPFRRRRTVEASVNMVAMSGVAAAAGAAFGALTVVSGDETLQQRVDRLMGRLELLASRVVTDRSEVEVSLSRLGERVTEQGGRLTEADEQIRALAKSVAVSSARLQLVGLILVGLGTALMAIPAIVSAL
jgi:hypothetical protein